MVSTNEKFAKHHYRGKVLYRLMCLTLLTITSTAMFFSVWYQFVKYHNQTGYLLGLGNLGMACGIYAVLYIVIGRGLHSFHIGIDLRSNLLASQGLTLFTVNVIELFVSSAITGQFRYFNDFIYIYVPLGLVQIIVIFLLTILFSNLYVRIFPPFKLIEIYGEYSNDLLNKISTRPEKYIVVESVKYNIEEDELRTKLNKYNGILINDIPAEEKNKLVKLCYDMDKRVYFIPKLSDIIVKTSDVVNLFDTPLYLCKNEGISSVELVIKRFFDILLSLLAFVVLSPLFLIVAIAIKLNDGGPVFFKQERVTLGGRKFDILKFRSMIVDAEKDGKSHPAGEKDDRITKVGRIIRATRVDELPQLINILKGEMSIVGPRPERVEHVEKYSEDIQEFIFRNKVKGGLTGYAQVYGKYNTSALDKLKMDLIYITNYSLLIDLQILFETIKTFFKKDSTEGFSEEEQKRMHGDED